MNDEGEDRWVADDGDATNVAWDVVRRLLPSGTAVERRIDDKWFQAVVLDSYVEGDNVVYDLEYVDDGNQEVEIPGSEVRVFRGTPPAPREPEERHRSPASVCDADRFDYAEGVPVAKLHGNAHEEATSAFVVNGATTKLGAGGGLHGVRFLRQSVALL